MAGNKYYLDRLDQMRALHIAKNAGYGTETDAWSNFRDAEAWGSTALQGCLVRMGDKYKRAQNLFRNPANDQVGEGIRDTLTDLAAYALIAICLMEEQDETNRTEAERAAWLEDEIAKAVAAPHENPFKAQMEADAALLARAGTVIEVVTEDVV